MNCLKNNKLVTVVQDKRLEVHTEKETHKLQKDINLKSEYIVGTYKVGEQLIFIKVDKTNFFWD